MKFKHRTVADPIELGVQMPSAMAYSTNGPAAVVVVYPSGESFSLPIDVARLIYEPLDARADELLNGAIGMVIPRHPEPPNPQEEFRDAIDGLTIETVPGGGAIFRKPRPKPSAVRALRKPPEGA